MERMYMTGKVYLESSALCLRRVFGYLKIITFSTSKLNSLVASFKRPGLKRSFFMHLEMYRKQQPKKFGSTQIKEVAFSKRWGMQKL